MQFAIPSRDHVTKFIGIICVGVTTTSIKHILIVRFVELAVSASRPSVSCAASNVTGHVFLRCCTYNFVYELCTRAMVTSPSNTPIRRRSERMQVTESGSSAAVGIVELRKLCEKVFAVY